MKNQISIIILEILFILPNVSFSQHQITKRIENYVLLNINNDDGYNIGNVFKVYRNILTDAKREIGQIQIVKFQAGKCACKIIYENINDPISVGDFIIINEKSIIPPKTDLKHPVMNFAKKESKILPYLSVGLGLLSAGIGYYYYDLSLKTYTEYESAYTTNDAVRLYDETIEYYNKSKICFGVGGGLAILGILYSIFDKPHPVQKQENYFSLKPINMPNTFGFSFQICLDKQIGR